MRKLLFCIFLLSLFWGHSLPMYGQNSAHFAGIVKDEKDKFLVSLRNISIDSAFVDPIARSIESELTGIYTYIRGRSRLSATEKEKASKSLVFFMKELGRLITEQKFELYDIPGALQSYKNILTALINHRPLSPLVAPLEPRSSQLMAAAFTQYKEYPYLNDVAIYKRVVSSPDYILQFLESKPGFRFTDSLILDVASHDPLKLASYLNHNDRGIQDQVRGTHNIYVQQIVTLSHDKNVSELLPFVTQIAERKLTAEEILEKRMDIHSYYQLLVNALKESIGSSYFQNPLRNGIKQKALAFYVNPINELHNSSDAVRFASVKGLRPEDIYYVITSCGEELYTSSYLGLYKRLMEQFKNQPADSLFDIVKYDNFHLFVRMAANYNVLADFLSRISPEKARVIINRFVSGIENDTGTGLERAMDIADSFGALAATPELLEMIHEELLYNMRRCTAARQYPGMRIYNILLQVFELVNDKGKENVLWNKLGNYEILKRQDLVNKNGEITEVVLFYGDEDGVASFSNFLRLFTDTSKWKISKNDNWINIRSNTESPVNIYANRPLEIKTELDLKAQDSLFAFLGDQQSLEPVILVHRGHSYHLDKTLRRLTPSVKLAILGSCGGYNKALSIATINPDVQVIGSKKTGSKSINDPIIDVINEALVNKEDLIWPEVWKILAKRFSKDEGTLSLFNEYFPPANNLGLFVLKLYKYYNRVG